MQIPFKPVHPSTFFRLPFLSRLSSITFPQLPIYLQRTAPKSFRSSIGHDHGSYW